MPIYNLIEYSDNYSKKSGDLRQYYRDDPNDNIANSESFGFKINKIGKTPAAGNTIDVKTAVPLKFLRNFWRTLEIPLSNCEINLIFTLSENCVISSATGKTKFAITDTKLYVPIAILSAQDNAKLLQELKSGLKRTVNWNKNQSKVTMQEPNPYLDYLIDPSFPGVNSFYRLKIVQIEQYTQNIIFQL